MVSARTALALLAFGVGSLFLLHTASTATTTPLLPQQQQQPSSLPNNSIVSAKLWNTLSGKRPQIVGHRGEKAFMPEHSRASYWQAALEEADYIEPDLAMTKDGHLVVNHNEWVGDNTNVREIPELAHLRKESRSWDGGDGIIVTVQNEWFICDMTLDQIKMLRLRQDPRYPWRPSHFDDVFEILTFVEYLEIVRNVSIALEKPFGVIPELKSPRLYNEGRAYPRYFEDRAILTLAHYGWANITAPLASGSNHSDLELPSTIEPLNSTIKGPAAWQSFDLDTAEYLSSHTDVAVVALNENQPWFFTPKGLDRVSRYAHIVSPWKDFFASGAEAVFRSKNITWDAKLISEMGGFIKPEELVREIHARGMQVSPYTFYDSHQPSLYLCVEGAFCPSDRRQELRYFFDIGTDYLFVENIPEARVILAEYAAAAAGLD
ncbi:hypothetical protein H4217_003472 [Coemansia sp. RSA 1939]|nr:hypothetical protein H4217_003472 [Coemansia sp. RSA 1939]KAJ2612057.1 hypothetical protein EV177_003176 [Coemansia sp. RSA 1804]KAJ2694452.1 hypothetical protein GGH99_000674 [Coemansia sp. RSA 1285]